MVGSKTVAIIIPAVLLAAAAGVAGGVRYRDHILMAFSGNPLAAAVPQDPATSPASATAPDTLYTCGMHPRYFSRSPGLCPYCGMPLTPVHTHASDQGAGVRIDPTVVQNMGIRTVAVEQGELRQSVRAVGTIAEPEQSHFDVNLRVSGWVQKLYANQEGMLVEKGQALFDLYSPEITAAADELIAARKSVATLAAGNADPVLNRSSQSMLAAGKRKLELLGLSAEQIDALAKLDQAPPTITISSPIHGHIATKMIIEGSAVKPGDRLLEIADRSTMWLQVQVFEQQLGLIARGEKVRVSVTAFPGEDFDGLVDFIYPHLDTATRTAMVRVILPNAGHRLHQNMYATAEIEVPSTTTSMLIPREAVIDSGLRQIVFLVEPAQKAGTTAGGMHFLPRQVTLGRAGRQRPSGPELVQVLSGLSPTDTVVTSGQFLLDSESRLEEAQQKFLAVRDTAKPATQPPLLPPNPHVDAIIRAYLPLAAFFGAPQKEATPVDPGVLARAASELSSDPNPALAQVGQAVLTAANALQDKPIDQQRTAFKVLSRNVVDLARQQALSPGFGKLYAFRCTMDNSVWLQQTPDPANPYFPIEMKTCGEVTQSLAPTTTAPSTEPGP